MFGELQTNSDNTKYYEILGVPKITSQDDLKKAYRKAAIKNHLDRGGDPEKCVNAMCPGGASNGGHRQTRGSIRLKFVWKAKQMEKMLILKIDKLIGSVFRTNKISIQTAIGIAIAIVGVVIYSLIKANLEEQKKARILKYPMLD